MVGEIIFFFLQGYPQTVSLGKFPQTSSLGKGVGQSIHSRVSPKHLCGGGNNWCRRWGSNYRLVGKQSISAHVNILESTLTLHTLMPISLLKRRGKAPDKPKDKDVLNGYYSVFWQENYVVWIPLEPWLNACPLHAPAMCKGAGCLLRLEG